MFLKVFIKISVNIFVVIAATPAEERKSVLVMFMEIQIGSELS